ncbi:Type II secretion system protein F [Pontiella desulfatans]|uniref:General secretion pathway protein F n=1 Tax=Pontiella desulfatans TaxID=2750659 RepID=A0A6C2U517_PONDE|nr:type II secretion system F family protein [Pontiella desulfatans]VGO15158.1 Type II secretion system protein F [Pontiella desulfatans]
MTKFSYKAVTAEGESRTGFIEAPTETRAIQQLQRQRLVVLKVVRADALEGNGNAATAFGKRITVQQLMEFSSETSALLDARIPLEQALKTQADLCPHPRFKEVLTEVWKDVTGGASFADALSRHPKVFERFYSNMVRGGEASGSLDLIMRRIATLLERRQKVRSKVVTAMIYPSLLLIMGIAVVAIMMVFVIPKLIEMFEDSGEMLPASTRALIGLSGFCREYWWLGPLLVVLIAGLFKFWTRSEEGRVAWGTKVLRIPILGGLLAEAETSRFCRMLSALLEGQVPILQAISITGGTLGNAALQKLMRRVYEQVQGGKPMGAILQNDPLFPELAARMVSMGEDSGELGTMLNKVADRYEEKVSASTDRFVSVLEPAFIVVLAVIVGFIVVAMMQGIMAMSTSAS